MRKNGRLIWAGIFGAFFGIANTIVGLCAAAFAEPSSRGFVYYVYSPQFGAAIFLNRAFGGEQAQEVFGIWLMYIVVLLIIGFVAGSIGYCLATAVFSWNRL